MAAVLDDETRSSLQCTAPQGNDRDEQVEQEEPEAAWILAFAR